MTRLYFDLGPRPVANIAVERNPLSQAITSSLDISAPSSKRPGIVPTITLVSSLVTVGSAHAAVFEVANLNDTGPGSLRQAVSDANANAGPDAITFADGVTGTLTLYNGEIDIYDSLVIQGPGEANLSIDADDNSRIFDIQQNQSGAFTEINDLTLTNGNAGIINRGKFGTYDNGGAIRAGYLGRNRGSSDEDTRMTLNNVTISNSYSSSDGGAIYTSGTILEVNNATFIGNTAYDDGGALFVDDGALMISDSEFTNNSTDQGDGGAINVEDTRSVVIDNSMINSNQSSNYGGAIAGSSLDGSVLISNSTLSSNLAGSDGGAIYLSSFDYNSGNLTIDNSQITNNTASESGGGIQVGDGSLFVQNSSVISNNSSISGAGIFFNSEYTGQTLTVDSSTISNNTANEGYGGGIFFYAEGPDLTIRDSFITGNYSNASGGGIAIYYDGGSAGHEGAITIQNTMVANNTASNDGGGLFMEVDDMYAPILIEDSDFIGNTASQYDGGGLHFYFDDGLYSSAIIRNTTIADNSAGEDGGGLSWYDDDGYSLVIQNSTISGNYASDDGGGINFYSDDGALLLSNSTVSGNSAGGHGGGLYLNHKDGDGRIDNSTIVDNYAYYGGGGIYNATSGLNIRSSIIANNSTYSGNGNDIGDDSGELYVQFSLIEDPDGISLTTNFNNIFYADPALGPLADNGGATMSHALLAGSPAIDTGLNIAPAADDQRGIGFARMVGLQTDIGAIESDTDAALSIPTATQTVTNLDDNGPGSLRQAVIDANMNPGEDVIDFDPGLSGTITLTSGELDINDDLIINAPVPSVITVDGGGNIAPPPTVLGGSGSRAFRASPGRQVIPMRGGLGNDDYNLLAVDIIGLTITNGYSDENGGAIYARDTELTLRDSTITNSVSNSYGGGIFQYQGVTRIIDSTLSYNTASAEGDGGGIAMTAYYGNLGDVEGPASLVFRGSTVSNNTAYDGGGLTIIRGSSLAIDNSTIENNNAGNNGAGIYVDEMSGSISISDSTISANTATDEGGGILINDLNVGGDRALIDNTTISNNVATDNDGGGIAMDTAALEIINNSLIDGNTAGSDGGGIYFGGDEDGSTLFINNSTISNNSAANDGGGIHHETEEGELMILNSMVSNNYAGDEGGGLSVYYEENDAAINIISSTFDNNTATNDGGGILIAGDSFYSTILIEDTVVSNNYSGDDGGGLSTYADYGFYQALFTIRDSSFINNEAADNGGGIYIFDEDGEAEFIIENTTLSGNTAGGNGGGLWFYSDDGGFTIRNSTISNNSATGYGGGIFDEYAEFSRINNSTIVNNSATDAGGIYADYEVTINSSIIANNTATNSGQDIGGDADFYFQFSLLGDDTDIGSVDLYDNGFNVFGEDPVIGALADNGGPTETHALLAGSPAINRGINFAASVDDQRLTGFLRTQGPRTDIGAFETVGNPVVLSLSVTDSPLAEDGGIATIDALSTEAVGQTTLIDLSFAGVAVLDTDFSVDGNTLLIPTGTSASSVPVSITGIDDPIFEGDELIDINGASTRGGAIPSTTATITDDDPMPSVTLSLVGSPVIENAGTATLTATLSNPSVDDVTVNLATSGTADPGEFTLPTSIVVPAGMLTADVTLTSIDDTIDEPDETVVVDIDSVTNGTEDGVQQVTATITDDDDAPMVTLSLVGDPIAENGGSATITATLSNQSVNPVTANLAFSGLATAGVDFNAPTSIVVPPLSDSADITLTTIDDVDDEGDENVIVDIDTVVNGTENGAQQVTTTIIDDDGILVSVSLSVTEIDEGGNADVILTLDEVAPNDIQIDLGFSGTAMMPDDFTVSSSTVNIPAGETSGTVVLSINLDMLADPNETIIIDIIGVTGGAEDGEQQATLIVRDTPVEVPTLSQTGKWLMILMLPLAGLLGMRRRERIKILTRSQIK